jgi:hypothetical protein
MDQVSGGVIRAFYGLHGDEDKSRFFLRVATFMLLCSSVPSLKFVHFIFCSLPIIQIFVKPLSHSAISNVLNCQFSVQHEAVPVRAVSTHGAAS